LRDVIYKWPVTRASNRRRKFSELEMGNFVDL